MAPYPASLGAVVARSSSPTAIPDLSVSPLQNKRSPSAQQPHYLNSTTPTHKFARSAHNIIVRDEHNLTALSERTVFSPTVLNSTNVNAIAARSDQNLTTRSDQNLTARSDNTTFPNIVPRALNLTARSDQNLTARSEHNVTVRSDIAQPPSPYLNFTTRSGHNLTARSDYYVITSSGHNLTTRSTLTNLTVRSDQELHEQPYHNITIRSGRPVVQPLYSNVTARSLGNLTARSDLDLTARSDNYNLTARSGYNLTTRSDFNLTARSESLNITARTVDYNLTPRSDHNLTARSDFNLTARSDYNLSSHSDTILEERAELNTTDLSDHKMIIRNPNYNLSGVSDSLLPNRHLVSRSTSTYIPCAGCTNPNHINNNAFFALFAILGVALVCVSIWFFFHAKNGGFQWTENDWDDYKSTVLRRKGPDGKTLSNATKSTRLGGGSIIAKHDRLAAMTVVGYDEKGRKGVKAKRGFGGTHSIYYSDDFSRYDGSQIDEKSEVASQADYHRHHRGGDERHDEGKHHSHRYRDRDVQHYKKEKSARVGGMNRPADGSNYSDHFSDTMTQITESTNRSTANLIKDPNKERSNEQKKRSKAERKAREEAAKMERKWRKDAEEAARAIARENAPSPVPPQQAHRERHSSRSASPKKRDYSFSRGEEDISTQYTGTSGTRSASYYDAYRPQKARASSRSRSRQQGSPTKGYRRHAESDAEASDSGTRIYDHRLNRGPTKEKKSGRGGGGRDVMAGYRRGRGNDSDEEF